MKDSSIYPRKSLAVHCFTNAPYDLIMKFLRETRCIKSYDLMFHNGLNHGNFGAHYHILIKFYRPFSISPIDIERWFMDYAYYSYEFHVSCNYVYDYRAYYDYLLREVNL